MPFLILKLNQIFPVSNITVVSAHLFKLKNWKTNKINNIQVCVFWSKWHHILRTNQEKCTADGKLGGAKLKKKIFVYASYFTVLQRQIAFICLTQYWAVETVLEASARQTLLSVFKQTLRKSEDKFWIIKKVCGLHNNSLPQQNADESAVINGNGCSLSGAGLQGLLECDASVSTAGLNAQLSATTALLTAHKHPVIAVFKEVRAHTDLSYLHRITFVPLPLFSQLAGSDLSCSARAELAWIRRNPERPSWLHWAAAVALLLIRNLITLIRLGHAGWSGRGEMRSAGWGKYGCMSKFRQRHKGEIRGQSRTTSKAEGRCLEAHENWIETVKKRLKMCQQAVLLHS